MEQDARALRVTNILPRRNSMAKLVTDKPFLFKAIPEYGDYQKAPQPALPVLSDWYRVKHQT